ncbi:LIM and calponin homology domains-containing protein 1a isoform X10 [Amia ocellicauda]|uniref:LIM and calponin homology domains-containing protein 1a isoform X10 n=1 Tax=Amia ocellicauda TaxID=2972642 RepID=UPI0034644712
MASPGLDLGRNQQQDSSAEPAFQEAQKWIEAVTGRRFGDRDFRGGLENGILLCELLSSIKPGLVKKINRLPTPIAGLDNLTLFLRGCEELGLKGTQLFDPGDLQDTSVRANLKGSDCSRKLKNVLITIYWLGKAANSCASYNGPTLDLKEFEGLLSQMRKEAEDIESPKRSIRDSGYIDCWDSERSDSLSPPRHGRDDSFDSLDSFGSRSQQTPSPDVVIRGSSDGRGSDSETDTPHRKLPDVRKDDMLARRTSYNEPRNVVPFNQYLPNKSNQSGYVPAPLRKKKAEREESRKSWSTATSPIGGERPFSHPETILEEHIEVPGPEEEEDSQALSETQAGLEVQASPRPGELQRGAVWSEEHEAGQSPHGSPQLKWPGKNEQEVRKLQKLEKAGIRVLPASARYSSPKTVTEEAKPSTPDIILRRENEFLRYQQEVDWDSDEEEQKVPDVEKDDLASRRARMNQFKPKFQHNQFLPPLCSAKDKEKWEAIKKASQQAQLHRQPQRRVSEESTPPLCQACIDKGLPVIHAETAALDDLASRRARVGRKAPSSKPRFVHFGPVTEIDQKRWERLSIAKAGVEDEPAGNGNESDTLRRLLSAAAVATPTISCGFLRTEQVASSDEVTQSHGPHSVPRSPVAEGAEKKAAAARSGDGEQEEERQPMPEKDDMMARRTGGPQKGASGQPFNKFLPLPGSVLAKKEAVPESPKGRKEQSVFNHSAVWSGGLEAHEQDADPVLGEGEDTDEGHSFRASAFQEGSDVEEEDEERIPDLEKDDMHARRTGIFQKAGSPAFNLFLPVPGSLKQKQTALEASDQDSVRKSSSSGLSCSAELYQQPVSAVVTAAVVTPKESPEVPRKLLQRNKEELVKDSPPDMEKDDMRTRRTLISLKQTMSAPTHFLPVPASQQARTLKAEADEAKPRRRPSWLDDDLPPIFSHRTSVSDDGESVSMIDMRCEDEAILQPHSKARHEHLHNLHNKLREEEDQWQDDLARWKNRRRSASQDLIKKEEERKMMERLMTGEGSLSERRKSIKTYREIVEEKERRERELHEAYRNAKTPEEAEAVLQRYTQRFTISEAVLERLQLPRCLERSVSVDPSAPTSTPSSSSPTKESNAMKYLRQQSLPAPKFTATVEATIGVVPLLQAGSPHTSPTRTVSSKAVPLLTPKPYSQPGLKSVKVDGMVRVNGKTGELFSRAEDEIEGTTTRNLLSPSRSLVFESTARLTPSPVKTPESPRKETSSQDRAKQDTAPVNSHMPTKADAPPVEMSEQESVICASLQSAQKHDVDTAEMLVDTSPARPTSLPTELQKESAVSEEGAFTAVAPGENRQAETAGEMAQKEGRCVDEKPSSYVNSVVIEQRCVSKGSFPTEGEEERTERQTYQTTVVLGTTQHDLPSKEPGQEAGDAFVSSSVVSGTVEVPSPSVQSSHESAEQELTNSPSVPHRVWNSWLRWEFFTQSGGPEEEISNIAAPPLNLAKRTDHWSWDPEEERKRQERWQQEQERMLQMKYQREQEKLKQEWERAQKEVEEEERKYHEEERKILEETVAPLTPRSSTLSSPSRSDQPHLPLDPEGTIVRSLADWEHKQELLERQARAKEEGVEKDEKLSDNGKQNGVRKEQKMTLKAEEKMTESSHSQSITHTETIVQSQQNGQRLLSDHSPPAVSELQFIQDASWNNKQPLTKQPEEVWKKTASLDRNWSQQQAVTGGMKRSGSYENVGISPSKSSSCSSSLQTQSPNRSVSGKKLCSSCGHPLGKGAAMIIETLSLYFHIQCFKCGICKGQLGDTTTGTDVRIRNGLLNCNECYIKSRTAGQPTTL